MGYKSFLGKKDVKGDNTVISVDFSGAIEKEKPEDTVSLPQEEKKPRKSAEVVGEIKSEHSVWDFLPSDCEPS